MKKLIPIFLLLFASSAMAELATFPGQQRGRGSSAASRHRAPVLVKRLPSSHQRIVVNRTPYFFSAGIFYLEGPRGFRVVAAPIGARIRVLPHGSVRVHLGGVDYFYFYGAYYLWVPEHKAYEVVEPPQERPGSDVLRLVNGEVLHGQFLEGDENSLRFAVGDEIHQVPLTEVVSLELEPPPESDQE